MSFRNFIIIVILGALLFLPGLGSVHLFDWDEINFAESAREMLATGNYSRVQINYQPFWEKPPLFIWLQALSMAIFGVNEFAARLPNALAGIATLLCLFYIGGRQYDRRFAPIWVLCYVGSILPFLYFNSGIIDPLFNLFIFLSVYQFSRLTKLRRQKESTRLGIAALAGLFCGLAILTKGPAALLDILVVLLVYWATRRFQPFLRLQHLVVFFFFSALITSLWFLPETLENGPWFISEFIRYQFRLVTTGDAGHGQPFWYHWVVLLIGVYPASLFIFRGFRNEMADSYEARNLRSWMIILLFVHLIIFSIVRTKIVHYSSLCYFPMSYLAAHALFRIIYRPAGKVGFGFWLPTLLMGVLWSVMILALPFFMMRPQTLLPLVQDAFGREALMLQTGWQWYHGLAGLLLLAACVAGVLLLARPRTRMRGLVVLFAGTAIAMKAAIWLLAPQIEKHSQGSAIRFMERKAEEKAYIDVIGYKSYAQYFYGRRALPRDTSMLNSQSLLWKPLDRPAYFVTKINRLADVRAHHPYLKVLGQRGGFVFLRREAGTLLPPAPAPDTALQNSPPPAQPPLRSE